MAKALVEANKEQDAETLKWVAGAGPSYPKGSIMSVTIEVLGQSLILFNGGPHMQLSPAFSLFVTCKTQKEIDYYWKKLSAEPRAEQCGWLKDKYGVSWQICPAMLLPLMTQKSVEKSARTAQAMMKMKKLDIKALKAASDGK